MANLFVLAAIGAGIATTYYALLSPEQKTAMARDLERLWDWLSITANTDAVPYCEARRRGRDPQIIQIDPSDWGPMAGSPGSPSYENPNPKKPIKKPDPKKWEKMSRWQKTKWILK